MRNILILCASLCLAGCASSGSAPGQPSKTRVDPRTVNWNERIGHYTYDQAVAELGRPAVVGESSDGRQAEWVIARRPRVSFGFGVGGGSYGVHPGVGVGVGVGSSYSPPPHGENLRLKFGADGQLKEWTKVQY